MRPEAYAEADKRAQAFLRSIIGDYEYRRMKRDGYFMCHGSDGRKYRIYTEGGTSHNIIQMDDRNVTPLDNWCVHLASVLGRDAYGYQSYFGVPEADHFAGQYLGLLCAANAMRRIAYRGGPVYARDWIAGDERRRARQRLLDAR